MLINRMKLKKFLLEIYSDEIPPSAQDHFIESFKALTQKTLGQKSIAISNLESEITSCRVVLLFDIDPSLQSSAVTIKGPKINADKASLIGFMKKHSIAEPDISKEDDHYLYRIDATSKHGLEKLLSSAIKEICLKASNIWPKRMKWDSSGFEWTRPIKSIICMLDEGVLPLDICDIKAGRETFPSKRELVAFASHEKPRKISLKESQSYKETMRANHVIISKQERIRSILEQSEELRAKASQESGHELVLKADPKLVAKLAGFSENPIMMLGSADKFINSIPDQILLQTMLGHQFYIPLYNLKQRLDKRFLFLTDIKKEEVINGNQHVLLARFTDADFFFKKDEATFKNIKTNDTLVPIDKLSRIALGGKHLLSMKEKAERIAKIFISIAQQHTEISNKDKEKIYWLTYILKLDIATNVVRELPDLQGSIGSEYWERWWSEGFELDNKLFKHEKLIDEIAIIIKNQHGLNFEPMSFFSRILVISNSIEHVCSLFWMKKAPTSSQDPFGAKKHVKNIIMQSSGIGYLSSPIDIDLSLNGILPEEMEAVRKEASDFILSRFLGPEKNLVCSIWNIELSHKEEILQNQKIQNTLTLANTIKIYNEIYQKTNLAGNIVPISNRLENLLQTAEKGGSKQTDPNQEEKYLLEQAKILQEKSLEAKKTIAKNLNNPNLELNELFLIGANLSSTLEDIALRISDFIEKNMVSGNARRLEVVSEVFEAIQEAKDLLQN